MANTSTEPVADGKRYKASPIRIAILGLLACGIYGAGIGMVVWAAYLTNKAFHGEGTVPFLPWAAAFVLMVSGMLSVIYGFFFRPREVRLNESQVALVYWDGNGKVMDRAQVESMQVTGSRVVLRGGGRKLVIGPMFSDWKKLRGELGAWGGKSLQGSTAKRP
jgi:hypothetical protein